MSSSSPFNCEDKSSENVPPTGPKASHYSSPAATKPKILKKKSWSKKSATTVGSEELSLKLPSHSPIMNPDQNPSDSNVNPAGSVNPPAVAKDGSINATSILMPSVETQPYPVLHLNQNNSLIHPAVSSVPPETKTNNFVKHVLVNESETDKDSIVTGFILNQTGDKNLVLVSDNTKPNSLLTDSLKNSLLTADNLKNSLLTPDNLKNSILTPDNLKRAGPTTQTPLNHQVNLVMCPNGNLYSLPKPQMQSLIVPSTAAAASNSNVTNLTISRGAIKNKMETGSLLSNRPSNQGSFIRLPVANMSGKVLQCTSTAVSLNSTTCSPKQLATAPAKSVVSQQNLLVSLSSQKQSPSQNIIRLAVKNGKLVPDLSLPAPPGLVMSSKKTEGAPKGPVTLPKQPMSMTTVPSIVPIPEGAMKSNVFPKGSVLTPEGTVRGNTPLKANILSSLLHKNPMEADQTQAQTQAQKKNAEMNQFFSAFGLTNKIPTTPSTTTSEESNEKPATIEKSATLETPESKATSLLTQSFLGNTTTGFITAVNGVPAFLSSNTLLGGPPGLLPVMVSPPYFSSVSTASLPVVLSSTTTTPAVSSFVSSSVTSSSISTSTVNSVPPTTSEIVSSTNVSSVNVPSSSAIDSSSVATTMIPTTDCNTSTSQLSSFVVCTTASIECTVIPTVSSIPAITETLAVASLNSTATLESTSNLVEKSTSDQESSKIGDCVGTERKLEDSKDNVSPAILSLTSPTSVDPKKLLSWTNVGVGTLAGSSIKFKLNEFGMMEIDDNADRKTDGSDTSSVKDGSIDDNSMNKENFKDFLLCKENVEESENLKENRNLNSTGKKNKRKEAKHEIRIDEAETIEGFKSSFNDKFDEIFNQKCESYQKAKMESSEKTKHKHKNEHRTDVKQEIFQCKGCNCYGLSDEFFNERSCSVECERDLKQKFVLAKKKEYEMSDMKRKKKEKYYSLLKKELQEGKDMKDEELKLKIEKMETSSVDDEPTSSCSSAILSQVKTPDVSDSNEDSNLEVLSVGSDKSSSKSSSQPPPPMNNTALFVLFKSLETLKSDTYHSTNKIFNPFKVGMKLEGIDPQHQSCFCVMTVADVQGYRLRLHFDGFNECHDFWVNANSPDIFPVGWCELKKRKLNPPFGYTKDTFNWVTYLKQCRAKAAPSSFFRTPASKVGSQFRKGMKLEAVDKKSTSLFCVASVSDIIDSRILIHFDSWGDLYDYWADNTAPYIHPIGWCQEQNHELSPPTGYKSSKYFFWDEYLKATKSVAVAARAFKPRQNLFKIGMKLEAVDIRVPTLIRPATIVDVKDCQLKIAYDGLPESYSFWIYCDDPNIYPPGWCEKTRHPLEPPPLMSEVGDCGVRGCKGYGHVKGLKFVRHFSAQYCPYAERNLDIDPFDHIPDRLQTKPDAFEVDEPTSKPSVVRKELLDNPEAASKPMQSDRFTPPPEKMSRLLDTSSTNKDASSSKDIKRRGRKRKYLKEMEAIGKDSFDVLRQEVIESVFRPGYVPSSLDSLSWTKHAAQLGISVIDADPRRWTHKQVAAFVTRIYNRPEKAQLFSEQEIDGEAFLMLSQKDLVDLLGLKLGPAIKIFNAIVLLRQKIS